MCTLFCFSLGPQRRTTQPRYLRHRPPNLETQPGIQTRTCKSAATSSLALLAETGGWGYANLPFVSGWVGLGAAGTPPVDSKLAARAYPGRALTRQIPTPEREVRPWKLEGRLEELLGTAHITRVMHPIL